MNTDELLALGTSTLLEASGLECAFDPEIRPIWAGAKVAGPAFPVRCARGDNLSIHIAMEKAPHGCVMVVDAGAHLAGYWGEVLTVAAQARGVKGLIIDGAVRDVDAIEHRKFPVFARGVSMRGTVKKSAPSVGQRLTVAGLDVSAGDAIVADSDGALALPASRVENAVTAARKRIIMETQYMERLRNGESTLEIFGLTDLGSGD